ncbi:hypothetical protein Vadar_009717 [Vaccinium darrowii]|uniref:Uncharacterized protein n=1 Tax=Vaccinium darrowii TaxID=229202 RepID=A0ACB7YUH6_9ERIC|nr:hypothetical protein Vadar_009717 [Vaccinium darrowii]
MAPAMSVSSLGYEVTSPNYKETELTLRLPGESRTQKSGTKRGFSERVETELNSSVGDSRGMIFEDDQLANEVISAAAKSPKSKAEVVGWPPVKSTRKLNKACKYVKVAVDGAPYLRKVDLEMYNSYQQLLTALQEMFSCFTICNYLNERKLMDPVNGSEYVPTYEDKDGDWMLVGDVPWEMFVESSKRLRLMKSSEAIGLGSSEDTFKNAQAKVVEEAFNYSAQ